MVYLRSVDEKYGFENGSQIGGEVGLQLVGHARDAHKEAVDQILAVLEPAAYLIAGSYFGRLNHNSNNNNNKRKLIGI